MSESDLQKLLSDSNRFLQLKNFLQLMDSHSGLQNLNFYVACIDLKKRWSVDSGKSLLRLIRMLYRTYVKSTPNHSGLSISISNQTRKTIRTKIKIMNESNIDCAIFHRAFQEVEEYLEKTIVVDFQNHYILNQISESKVGSTSEPLENQAKIDDNNETCNEYQSLNIRERKASKSKKSQQLDPDKFHQMLTEKLSQLKLPLKEDNSFKKLAAKTNNEFILRMIQRTQTIDIDIEADALSALDNQYKKIGRFKQDEMNNNQKNIFAYPPQSIKDSILRTKIPLFWRNRLQRQEQLCRTDSDLNSKLLMDIRCHCHRD